MDAQLSYMADALDQLEKSMIDPTEFGALRNEVQNLRRDMDDLTRSMRELANTMAGIGETLSKARGGWQALVWVSGVGASAGAAVAWILQHVRLTP